MDYTELVKNFHHRSCVLAVEKGREGEHDRISIAAANKAYLESVNKQDEEFVPGREYTYYIMGCNCCHEIRSDGILRLTSAAINYKMIKALCQ